MTHALLPTSVSEPDLRILGVVSTSCTLDAERHELFVRGLAHKCDRTPSLALIVNVFDAQLSPSIGYEDQARLVAAQTVGELCAPANTSSSSIYTASLPACVRGVSRVRGFKMATYKHVLTRELTSPYDFLWLFDNDMDVDATRHFDLLGAIRTMAAANVLIAQPRVVHINSSAHSAHAVMTLSGEDFSALNGSDAFDDDNDLCTARAVSYVESQTPLFSRAGWDIFRDRMLIRLDDDRLQLTDVGPDQVWCRMMELEMPSRPACAVLRATIIHGDFRTVRSSGHQADLASVALRSPAYMLETFPNYTDRYAACMSKRAGQHSFDCFASVSRVPRMGCLST